jgi:hypothetical protein
MIVGPRLRPGASAAPPEAQAVRPKRAVRSDNEADPPDLFGGLSG